MWVGVDLGRHGRSTPCVDALSSIFEIFDFDEDSSTHGVDLQKAMPDRSQKSVEGGVGPVAGA